MKNRNPQTHISLNQKHPSYTDEYGDDFKNNYEVKAMATHERPGKPENLFKGLKNKLKKKLKQ